MGMLHGRDSLRGGWIWARQHWGVLWRPLGGRAPHFPAYNTVRTLLLTLDPDDVDRRLRPWLERFLDQPLGRISADATVLRGSKRDDLPALPCMSSAWSHTTVPASWRCAKQPMMILRPRRAPDAQTVEKSRGRIEIREL